MKPTQPLHGLVAATHTAFQTDGSLNLAAVELQAAHLAKNQVHFAFIGGTTGESHSLTLDERRALAQRWSEVTRGSNLKVVVHVGANCLSDARALAEQAEKLGALAIAALAPSYFKPGSLDSLIACCVEIAEAAPETPFYFYDIPVLTGVAFPMHEFLEKAEARIPTLAGLKFTNPDLMTYLRCLQLSDSGWDLPWGIDEWLLAALATGARGAVGSSYNFAAPLYHTLIAEFSRGDMDAARAAQHHSAQLIALLARYGYMSAAKALMGMLGVNVGTARLPHRPLETGQLTQLHKELDQLGFFEWVPAG